MQTVSVIMGDMHTERNEGNTATKTRENEKKETCKSGTGSHIGVQTR